MAIVVIPWSYEQVQVVIVTCQPHLEWLPSWKQTRDSRGALPRAGCGVASQPVRSVPHRWYPGASVGILTPASPAKRYHCASARLCPAIGESADL